MIHVLNDGSVLLDRELVGALTAIGQWARFTDRTLGNVTVLQDRSKPNRIVVYAEVWEPGVLARVFPMLTVNYTGGELECEGKTWFFIIGDHGLEFRETA